MKPSRFSIVLGLLWLVLSASLSAQTLYVPGGSGGIGSSANGNVGIGSANLGSYKLYIKGDPGQDVPLLIQS